MSAHKRRWLRRTVLVLGVLGVLLILDGLWLGLTTRRNLQSARDAIQSGADALVHGQVAEAASQFDRARQAADRAGELGAHPAGMLAGALPWIGDNVHAVDDLAKAASLTAQAGQTLAGAGGRVVSCTVQFL